MAGGEALFLIGAVLVGPTAPFGPHGGCSGIVKTPATGPVRVEMGGMVGDEQADRRHHGGPEKAVHHYAFDHYAAWEHSFRPARPAVLATPGAFGENLSTSGLTEAEICVGDIWRAGTALLQVSQARQPCFKLNHRFGVVDMANRVQSSGRTGWYYRVIEPGAIAAGDALRLVERAQPNWPISRLLHVFYVDRMDRSGLKEIAAIQSLSLSWRSLAAKRLQCGVVEPWAPRLNGDQGGTLKSHDPTCDAITDAFIVPL